MKAYAEAIEQYGRNDLTYWKDKLLARQLSNADALEPLEVKKDTDAVTTKRKQQLSSAAVLQPANSKIKPPQKRKIGKSGFKYPPKVIAGIKVWGSDDMSDSGDEAVRDYKKIKLEHEKDGDPILFSAPQSQAPILQASMLEEEENTIKHHLPAPSSAKTDLKVKDEQNDSLFFLSPSPPSPPSSQQTSTFSAEYETNEQLTKLQASSKPATKSQTPASQGPASPTSKSERPDQFPTTPDPLPKSARFTSSNPPSPRFVRTQNSPSRPFFEKVVYPATRNSQSRPPIEAFPAPTNPYNPPQPPPPNHSTTQPANPFSPTPPQTHNPANSFPEPQ